MYRAAEPLHPGVDRVGGDDVELLLGREDVVPGVVVDDLDARIVQHVVVLLAEEARGDLRDQRLDLADDDPLDVGVQHERAGGDARPAADDEHRARLGVQEGREVAEHPLQPHVGRLGRGLDLAADVEVDDIAVEAE